MTTASSTARRSAAVALGQNLKAASVATDDFQTATESARRSLARFELAAIRLRNAVRLRLGVSDDELTALLHLVEYTQITQGQLVAIGTLSRSGVGAMVARLEDAGFVERVQDPTDRRVRLLQLSPGGVRRMREAYGPREDDVSKLLSKRPREELEPLAALLLELSATTQGHAGAVEREPPLAGANGAPVWRKWG
jgi:DNA-binding MarR family transcriptional regulator